MDFNDYQGKLLTKHKVPWFVVCLELTSANRNQWLKNIFFIAMSFYCNIFLLQYCVQKYCVWIGPKKDIHFYFLTIMAESSLKC